MLISAGVPAAVTGVLVIAGLSVTTTGVLVMGWVGSGNLVARMRSGV